MSHESSGSGQYWYEICTCILELPRPLSGCAHPIQLYLEPIVQEPISRKNRRLVADEPVEFKTWENLPIILEESIEYTSNEWKQQNRKMSVNM